MKKGVQDLVSFGRIVSAALLICGYVVFGVLIGRKLVEKGYPHWMLLLCASAGAVFGLWQGWLMIKGIIKK